MLIYIQTPAQRQQNIVLNLYSFQIDKVIMYFKGTVIAKGLAISKCASRD